MKITHNLHDIKTLQFTNIADLEDKVAKLKAIRDANLQETEEFLIITGIPFTRLQEGFGVDLQEVTEIQLQEYYAKFNHKNAATREAYRKIGVVFLMDTGNKSN